MSVLFLTWDKRLIINKIIMYIWGYISLLRKLKLPYFFNEKKTETNDIVISSEENEVDLW